ncbi:OmpA family protein [Allocoleopsis franciscana]|uniref:Outer membrane protein/peptidoglycan-associated (Lipo)protein n=1 Tax=Allocoleopsis franciscana PCC 7113 TaxID=1173027 RepID=K9WCA0_9CYAN|nr:OmpA family protein [Allocoleopsis franciscana]AFZ17117.1 outer membrane protein/peptidoglycan-associated (lipo)protein [Allocoleopsis franciscana PCC 7113]
MASSKENPSASSPLKGLVDLLADLQILNTPQKPQEESSPSQTDAPSPGEALGLASVEEYPDAPPKADAPHVANRVRSQDILEAETNTLIPSHIHEQESPETSHFAAHPSAIEDSLNRVEGEPKELSQPHPPKQQQEEPKKPSLLSQAVEFLQHRRTSSHSSEQQQEELQKPSLLSQPGKSFPNELPHFHLPEQQKTPITNPSVSSQVDSSQPKNLETPPEQIFNQLIESHWEKARRNEFINQSLGSTPHHDVDNSITLFERWQRLLLTQEVMDSRKALAEFKQKVETLEHQIYEPTELINLLLPLIAEILTLKVADSREDIAQAIAPVVDEMIQRRAKQDIVAISTALAPVIPEAVAKQVLNSPGALAKALGPEMGTAIKEQITLERDSMVDALYPVIGSTISKYMAEAIKAINEKVENAFSLEGLSRKVRAKVQGISEAELIFKESMPFTIQAMFLIHKSSGLVIAEFQPSDSQRLESEMVAGMLTAIRSFVNDVIAQTGSVSEIDQIDYGDSRIILEVAGYCYLAAVTKGEHPRSFIQKMRSTLSTIVQKQGKSIELFDGDPDNVPEEVHQLLDNLTKLSDTNSATKNPKAPVALLLIGLTVFLAISLPIGIYQYLSSTDRRREREINLALASDPELAVYRVGVDANLGTIKLSGKLPNQYLRSRAEKIAKEIEPKLSIQNTIIPVEVPPNPVLAAAEVKRVVNILNQIQGSVIAADYSEGTVTVKGAVLQQEDAKKITQAFLQIPGVKSVSNTVQLQPFAIASRIYFDQGSSEIKSEERSKIAQIRAFLDQHPNKYLKLLGHTDPKGSATENQQLALERATKVKNVLIAQGIASKRLLAEGTIDPPIGVSAEQLPLLSRCVEFEIISPQS